MAAKKPKVKKQPKNIALCVPRAEITSEDHESGLVNLLVPRLRHRWLQWLQRWAKSPHIRLKLDEIGSAAWKLIDGKRTVLQIGEELEKELGEKVHPVHERLGYFMGMLKRNKFVDWDYVEAESAEPIRPS